MMKMETKIVKLKGGLGNQMFQYAFALLLERETGEQVYIDLSAYKELMDDSIRQPRILKFHISIPVAGESDIKNKCILNHTGNMLTSRYRIGIALEAILNKKYYFERNRGYQQISAVKRYQYFDGYWQSYKHVDSIWEELRAEFIPNVSLHPDTLKMIHEVSENQSVFVGIRKGDYQKHTAHFGSFSQEYYSKAMGYVSEHVKNPLFYIFSNDIDWVKENLDFGGFHIVYREPEDVIDDFEDFLIMAACKHSIIVNSTYHWWAARLNEYTGKIVVAPEHWFFDDKPIDIIPPRWIRIPNNLK